MGVGGGTEGYAGGDCHGVVGGLDMLVRVGEAEGGALAYAVAIGEGAETACVGDLRSFVPATDVRIVGRAGEGSRGAGGCGRVHNALLDLGRYEDCC